MARHTRIARQVSVALLLGLLLPPAFGQYPSKPIRILTGFGASAAADIVARQLVPKLLEAWSSSGVIAESRSGANGLIATQEVARAAPDGYTLLLAAQSQISIAPNTSPGFPREVLQRLAPVAEVATADLAFVIGAQKIPAKTFAEYLAWVKSLKNAFIGDMGAGSITHLMGAYFGKIMNVNPESVHYKAPGDLWVAAFSGDVQGMFLSSAAVVPYVKTGQARALAMTGVGRSKALPDVPTFKELGYPDLEVVTWYGVFAPVGTPSEVLETLSTAFVGAVRSPEVLAKLETLGLRGTGVPRAEFGRTVIEDTTRWSKIVSLVGFKPLD